MQVKPLIIEVHSSKIVNQIYFKGIAKKFKLKPTELCVLIGLANHYNANKKDIFPTLDYMADHLNISVKSVNRAVKRLAELGLILYETKHNNRYVFTNIFFEALEMSISHGQNEHKDMVKMSIKHVSKHVNNKASFKKSDFRTTPKPINEVLYLSAAKTKEMIEETKKIPLGSPLDMPKEDAIAWFKSLMPALKNSFFATEIRKKYNL